MSRALADQLSAAVALHEAGRAGEAARLYEKILARAPRQPQALHHLGLLRISAGQFETGLALLRRAVEVQPNEAVLHVNLGLALLRAQQYEPAVASFRRALALDPRPSECHDYLAGALALSGDSAGAIATLREASRLFPRDPRFPIRLSALLYQGGDLEGARDAAKAALAVAPRHPDALVNLGLVEAAARDYGPALQHFEAALDAEPMHVPAQNNFAYTAGLLGDFARQERIARLIERRLAGGAPGDGWTTLADVAYLCPYLNLPVETHRRTLEMLAQRFPAVAALPPRGRTPAGDGRLRIGYVSTGFGNHAIGHVSRTLYAAHDRARFRIHAYSLLDRGPDDSGYYETIRAGFDEWRDVSGLDDAAAARLIRDDGIDVLVDLNGYLEGRRPGIFAYRPAPIQVFWLAHAGGLGLPFVDYLVADRIVVPPGEEGLYRENLVRLPEIYHCADALPISAAAPAPASEGLGAGIVFCAFNNPQKIDRRAFTSWMRILAAVPGSALWISDPSGRPILRDNFRRIAAASGVDGDRLVFAGRVRSKADHLARHRLAALFLDTVTVNAATTALDALWAGLPVLTLRGDRFAARMAETMVTALGLEDELVARDLADYEARAIALAGDPARLAALTARLRDAVATRPLFDVKRFCRHLERAFEGMWRRHEAGLPPAPFDVAPV